MQINKTGLILEGGGMRGVFTSGVLDCFMDNQVWFPLVIGVSAGACNALSYCSRQRGRSRYSNIDLLEKYKYIGVKYLFTKRCIMDFDLLFHELPERIFPFDYATFFNHQGRCILVTSNCITGEAEYLEEKEDGNRLLTACRASCSLPIVCPVTEVDGVPMLDGGVSDAIPVQKAIDEGYSRNVIVLTRNAGYRKSDQIQKLPAFIYRQYPALREKLENRNARYNRTLELIEQLEQEGRAVVIRPEAPLMVGRMEKNKQKLTALYDQGYRLAQQAIGQNRLFFDRP